MHHATYARGAGVAFLLFLHHTGKKGGVCTFFFGELHSAFGHHRYVIICSIFVLDVYKHCSGVLGSVLHELHRQGRHETHMGMTGSQVGARGDVCKGTMADEVTR
jgi:hypothetical protein